MIVSIVLYNHKFADIRRTLNNLLKVTCCKKVILIDNGGCEWASDLSNHRIIYIRASKNGGYGYGHNLAIKQFAYEAELFLICNPDIYFDVEQVNRLVDIALKCKEGLFSPTILYPNGDNQYGQRLLPTPINLFARRFISKLADNTDQRYLLKAFKISEPVFVPSVSGSFMLFKAEALIELDGFDERFFMYLEDIDLSRRCAKAYGNCYIPTVHIYHEHAQASYKDKKLLKAHIKSAIQYFNKWGWVVDSQRELLNQKCLEQFQ